MSDYKKYLLTESEYELKRHFVECDLFPALKAIIPELKKSYYEYCSNNDKLIYERVYLVIEDTDKYISVFGEENLSEIAYIVFKNLYVMSIKPP